MVAARREEQLSDLVERINGQNAGKALSVECDVPDEEQAHALIRKAKDELGRVDILVNNAGVMCSSPRSRKVSPTSGARCSTWTRRSPRHNIGFLITISADGEEEAWIDRKPV